MVVGLCAPMMPGCGALQSNDQGMHHPLLLLPMGAFVVRVTRVCLMVSHMGMGNVCRQPFWVCWRQYNRRCLCILYVSTTNGCSACSHVRSCGCTSASRVPIGHSMFVSRGNGCCGSHGEGAGLLQLQTNPHRVHAQHVGTFGSTFLQSCWMSVHAVMGVVPTTQCLPPAPVTPHTHTHPVCRD